MRKYKKILSGLLSLVLFAGAVLGTVLGLPGMAVPVYAETSKTGYHKGSLTKTYNIVKLDDQSYFSDCGGTYGGYRDSTKSKFSWPYSNSCAEAEDGADGSKNVHWYKQAASYYGFYDEVYKAWVMTGVQVYGGKSNRVQIDTPTSCNHTHDSESFNYNTRSWETAEIPRDKKIGDLNGDGADGISLVSKEGCTVTFSKTIHISGTVSVTYPDTWVPNEYTITFYPENGKSSFSKAVTYDAKDNNDVSSSTPSKTNYSFGGWYTQSEGKGEKVYDKDGNAVKGNFWSGNGSSAECQWNKTDGSTLNLYAYWIKDNTEVTLNFYKDNTLSETKTYSIQNGTTFNVYDYATESFYKNYHRVKADRTSWEVPAGKNSANVYYESNVLKMTYKGNGNTGGSTADTTAKYGSKMTVASNGFTRTGYSFAGWNTKSDGTGASYTAGRTFKAEPSSNGETITVYAQWKINSYKVMLSKGTGISSVSGAGNYSYGSKVSIDATPSTGYSWNKWTGSADTKTKNYKFNIGAGNMSFTANAIPNSYIVTFAANGGSCVNNQGKTVKSVTVTYDSGNNNDISSLVFASRNGYRFAGWKVGTSSVWSAKGLAVNGDYWSGSGNSAKWKHAGNVTASASWVDITLPTVTVSPSSNASYVTSLNVTITAADNESLASDNTYQYCLSASSSSPSGIWNSYTNNSTLNIGNGLTGTYYLWVKRVKDVTGNWSSGSEYHKFGPYYFDNTAPDLSQVNNSYGWYSEGTTITFDISDAHAGIKSAVLTDFNGVTLDNGDITDSRQFYFGSDYAAFYCLTVVDNVGNTAKKLFVVKIDKSGNVIPDNAVWKGLSSITLFAHWSPNSYKIHFEKNDNDSGSTRATGSMTDATFTYDESKALPANGFSRVGYTFAGWNRSADGTADNGSNYEDKAVVKNLTLIPNGIVNLYAQWASNEYTLTLNYNKPAASTGVLTGADEKSRRVWFDKSTGQLPEPGIVGWEFEGWYIDGTAVKGSDIWNYTSDKTAVAKWRPATYEVRLHSCVPEDALGTLSRDEVSVWTWTEDEYYSCMFTYDSESFIPASDALYSLEGYVISGWYSNELLTEHAGNGGHKKWNLTPADGYVVHLYPAWKDTSEPVIDVTPTHTQNPDADNDAVKSIDITITVTESGSGLSPDNIYEYGFSVSQDIPPSEWHSYRDAPSSEGFTVTLPDMGASLDGYYYLFVRQIKDRSGNSSTSPSATASVKACHIYGIYVFDNTAPSGTVKYVENNAMLGLFDENITETPYAVMTVYNPYDEISGVWSFTLHISDASDSSNSVDFPFTPDGTAYTCRFSLYDCLSDSEHVNKVYMQVIAKDRLGNTAALPVTQYDFGTMQTGTPITAEDIGFKEDKHTISNLKIPAKSPFYTYIRDNFRVEAFIENTSYKAFGTSFTGGHKGRLRIYIFGYVDSVSADFGSIKKLVNPIYDVDPDLKNTVINPEKREYIYLHSFFMPLYPVNSTYSDTIAFGYKGSSCQKRNVIYDMNSSLTNKIKTILKYNAR